MNVDNRYLNMRDAGQRIGQSRRWMQRNWLGLVKDGVEVHRVPKGSKKGHLFFSKASLDKYMTACRLTMTTERPAGKAPEGHLKFKILKSLGPIDYDARITEHKGM